MCGRYYLADVKSLKERFNLKDVAEWLNSRYNIAPSQEVPGIVEDDGRRLVRFKWGLIPHWAKKPGTGLINARSETADVKPSFRHSFKKQRCLLPASGFYEWKKEGGKKLPFCMGLASREPFAFAGLWSTYQSTGGERIETCAILTTSANGLVARIHERMPVILPREAEDLWLDPRVTDSGLLKRVLKPFPEDLMSLHRVSTLVNSPRNQGPSLLDPLDE